MSLLELLRPDIVVSGLEYLDQDDLARRGIRAVILDLDNTLCPWHGDQPAPACGEWVSRARDRFSLCVLSNTVRGSRLDRVGAAMGLPVIGRWGIGRKPFPGGFREALACAGTRPEETAMVGDQLFTDVLGANRLGMLSVWALPMSARELPTTRLVRRLERLIVRRLGITLPPPVREGGSNA